MNKSKIKYIPIAIVALIVLFLLTPINAISLENALVNESNGDIVFVHRNSNSDAFTVCWFDVNGELIQRENIVGGPTQLKFVGENLKVSVAKYDTVAFFDRDGTKSIINIEVLEEYTPSWAGWDSSYGYKEYRFKNYVYEYEETPYPANLFYSKYSMRIRNTETGEAVDLTEKETVFPFN